MAADGQTEERGGRRAVSDQATGGDVLGRREAETTCTWGKFFFPKIFTDNMPQLTVNPC